MFIKKNIARHFFIKFSKKWCKPFFIKFFNKNGFIIFVKKNVANLFFNQITNKKCFYNIFYKMIKKTLQNVFF
jgi:hypothetical protein